SGTVVCVPLDVRDTPVGLKANLPQSRQVTQPLADPEVARVVDRGLGPQGAALLVVLLDPGALVVDVERWRHPLGEHPRAEPARRPLRDPAVEDQLHPVRPAAAEVLADPLLEKDAP